MKTKYLIYAISLTVTLIALFAYRAFADNVGCQMHNECSTNVTFEVDSTYGCTANANETCTFTTTTGSHTFKATRIDNNKTVETTIDVSANGYDWTVSDSSSWQ